MCHSRIASNVISFSIAHNLKSQCDCTIIVSEAVYRGGISADIVESSDVTADRDSSTNECVGRFEDRDNTFQLTLADNTTRSQDAVKYTSYSTRVTPSMAAELPFRFTDCTDEDYPLQLSIIAL